MPGFKAERRGAEAWLRSRDVRAVGNGTESRAGVVRGAIRSRYTRRHLRNGVLVPVQRSSNKEDLTRLRTPSVSSTRYDPHVRSPRAIALPRPRKKAIAATEAHRVLASASCASARLRAVSRPIQRTNLRPTGMWHERESSVVISLERHFFIIIINFFVINLLHLSEHGSLFGLLTKLRYVG